MSSSKVILFVLALAASVVTGCKKDDNISEIPHIEFKDFVATGDSAYVLLSFTDGDGDLGLSESDTAGEFRYNFFMRYFEKQNGQFVEREFSPPFNYRIPTLTQSSRSKSLVGEIKVSITPFFYDFLSPYDTLKYEIYIKDRALHESNRVTTPEIVAPK